MFFLGKRQFPLPWWPLWQNRMYVATTSCFCCSNRWHHGAIPFPPIFGILIEWNPSESQTVCKLDTFGFWPLDIRNTFLAVRCSRGSMPRTKSLPALHNFGDCPAKRAEKRTGRESIIARGRLVPTFRNNTVPQTCWCPHQKHVLYIIAGHHLYNM